MPRIPSAAFGFLAFAGLASAPSFAHDFWIEPSTFRPEPGATLTLALRVGEHFQGEPVPRNPDKLKQFILVGPNGTMPIAGEPGAEPAGRIRVGSTGVYVAGYRSHPSSIELEPAKFEAYLREEGLESILQARTERGERDKPGRETYSRCAKAVLSVGAGTGEDPPPALGFTLELLPQRHPDKIKVNTELPVVLRYEGQPLRNATVTALNRDQPEVPFTGRTDASGTVSFVLHRPGPWLIKCVHMVRLPEGGEADWESLWASLTFDVPPEKAAGE